MKKFQNLTAVFFMLKRFEKGGLVKISINIAKSNKKVVFRWFLYYNIS